ncbi:MAG: type IV pilus assembly protein PilM [Candidatus Parcubacteria bacterium]|nr:type IV pilus assembly protein PilM [Candidatus Parcubacteria bacterium]
MFNLFKKPAFGLDISDYSAEIIDLEGSSARPKLSCITRTIFEPGIIQEGKILKKDLLKDSLQKLISNPQFGILKTNKVIFSLPESKSFSRFFDYPQGFKKEETESFIRESVLQSFPYSLEELQIDFRENKEGIIISAVPKDVISEYFNVFKDCGLESLAFENESESLARILGKQKSSVMVIDIGAKVTNLSVFDHDKLKFSVSLNSAGDNLTKAISESLKVSLESAEKMKREDGLSLEKKEGRVFLILQKDISNLIKEISRNLEYFQEKNQNKITEIILIGGSANLPDLPEYLSQNLSLPVALFDPWLKINIDLLKRKENIKKAEEINPLLYSVAIGAAFRGLMENPEKEGINFIPKGRKK